MKTYYINLDRAKERREEMEKAFGNEDLVRVDAIDGLAWESSNQSRNPTWKPEVREKFIEQGILSEKSHLPPTHAACNLSHRMAWDLFLRTEDPWCIILEDDVEPTDVLKGCKIENILNHSNYRCGVFYLMDERSLMSWLKLGNDGRVKRALTLAAYVINRRAAEIFMEALIPMMYLADFQLPICAFDGLQKWVDRHGLKKFESKRKVRALGLKIDGLVRHSSHAKKSQLGHPSPV